MEHVLSIEPHATIRRLGFVDKTGRGHFIESDESRSNKYEGVFLGKKILLQIDWYDFDNVAMAFVILNSDPYESGMNRSSREPIPASEVAHFVRAYLIAHGLIADVRS